MAGAFLDSNVLVYAFAADARAVSAQALLAGEWTTSVQVLNEFANVARRKLGRSWPEIREALDTIRAAAAEIIAVDIQIHMEALRLAERHGSSLFDALILAAALRANCETLWSEDMQDGMRIDGRLTVRNPFRGKNYAR
jgi:predicted nucleic acid-binding protein